MALPEVKTKSLRVTVLVAVPLPAFSWKSSENGAAEEPSREETSKSTLYTASARAVCTAVREARAIIEQTAAFFRLRNDFMGWWGGSVES
jgi:hypothetical protein